MNSTRLSARDAVLSPTNATPSRAARAFARTFDAPPAAAGAVYEPTDAVLVQLRALAPGWDRQALLAQYREWSRGKVPARNPHGAFLGWVKRFTKGKDAA